ncbi:MAG: ribosome silencing factor [Deltaproteobacteria bacterium]|nr:ribosome silencing factor [Deltaproteobacteria bacterium]
MNYIFREGDTAPSNHLTTEALAELALKTLMDNQALGPVLLEVKNLCSFADYFILCSGGSKRQVTALAQQVEEELAKVKVKPLGVEGKEQGLWVLMDYNTVVIHIFFRELREFYDLDGLWAEAPRTSMASSPAAISPTAPAPESPQNPESESGSGSSA